MKKQAYNPYLPSWEYTPDCEPYVFGDRVYIFLFFLFYTRKQKKRPAFFNLSDNRADLKPLFPYATQSEVADLSHVR